MGPKLVFGKALGEIGFGLVNAQLPKNEPASERARQFSMTVENSTLVGGGWVRFVGGKVREVRDFGVVELWGTGARLRLCGLRGSNGGKIYSVRHIGRTEGCSRLWF